MVNADAAIELLLLAGPRRQVPPERERRALAEVEQHWQRRVAARRRRRQVVMVTSLAAASLLVAAVLIWQGKAMPAPVVATVELVHGTLLAVIDGQQHQLVAGAAVPDGAILTTGEQGRAALRLTDGTSLRLDIGTRLSFAGRELARLDSGAAYLDTGSEGELGSMTLSTFLGDLIDVGTQYEVRLLEDALRVRVREGRVVLRRKQGDEEIRAGQELLLRTDGELRWHEISASDPSWSWLLEIAPPYSLSGSSVASFLRWVQRETGYELRWAEPTMAGRAEKIILQGDITGIRPDQAAELVLPTCGLGHHLEEGVLTVVIMPSR
jgi:ferric-dicitrate binding protein FerR (iron transport regulator)